MSAGSVGLVDVAPRDGLQSEVVAVDTATKIELIARLVDAGIRRVEAASFAHPRVVPQMADAEAVVAGLPPDDEATYVALVLNERGTERAIEAGKIRRRLDFDGRQLDGTPAQCFDARC